MPVGVPSRFVLCGQLPWIKVQGSAIQASRFRGSGFRGKGLWVLAFSVGSLGFTRVWVWSWASPQLQQSTVTIPR